MSQCLRAVSSCLFFLCAPAISVADAERSQAERVGNAIGAYLFTEQERKILRNYVYEPQPDADSSHNEGREPSKSKKAKKRKGKGKRKKGLPPGLAKKGKLPPGLARQLERNGQLPPGLEKKRIPHGLESRLPPPPHGHERVIVDGDVVLVEKATGIIKDILRDVVGSGPQPH